MSGSLSPFSIFSMWYTQPLFKKTKGCLRPFRDPQSEHFQAPASTLLKCPWARCWLTPSLQSHWSWPLPSLDEGKWKDKFPTCINPSSGKPIWLNCPFKFESCYVSGWNQQSSVSAQSVHLLLAFSRTCLAPACFASITIYKATIKVEGSPLAKRPECVKQQCSAKVDKGGHMRGQLWVKLCFAPNTATAYHTPFWRCVISYRCCTSLMDYIVLIAVIIIIIIMWRWSHLKHLSICK